MRTRSRKGGGENGNRSCWWITLSSSRKSYYRSHTLCGLCVKFHQSDQLHQQRHNISGIVKEDNLERKFITRTLKKYFQPFDLTFIFHWGETILICQKYIIKVAPTSAIFPETRQYEWHLQNKSFFLNLTPFHPSHRHPFFSFGCSGS